MKKIIYLLVFVTALGMLACVSFESKMKDIEKDFGPGAAFRECCKEVDDDPEDEDAQKFMEYYAQRAFNMLQNSAGQYAIAQNFEAMKNALVNGKSSLKYVLEESQKRKIILPTYNIHEILIKYCNAYLDQNIEKAEWELNAKEFSRMNSTLYNGANSANELIRFCRYNMINLKNEGRLTEIKKLYEKELKDYYNKALIDYQDAEYSAALAKFKKMRGINEANIYIRKCNAEINYIVALNLFNNKQYRKAYYKFAQMPQGFKDVAAKMGECLERGKIRVALMYFDGRDNHVLYEDIVRELQKDKFIKIVNTGNFRYRSIVSPEYAQKNDIDYVVSGIISEEFLPEVHKTKGRKKVWQVSDELHEVSKIKGSTYKRFVRIGWKAHYYEVHEDCNLAAVIQFRIDDAKTGELVKLRTGRNYVTDDIYYYECEGECHPNRFSFKNPKLDTISAKSRKRVSEWRPTYEEENFHKRFTRTDVMRSYQELWGEVFFDMSRQIAREIAREIIMREDF